MSPAKGTVCGKAGSKYVPRPGPMAEAHRCRDLEKLVEERDGRKVYQCQECGEIRSESA